MEIKDMDWTTPTSKNKDRLLRDWELRFCGIERSTRHWQEGRSAQALADFFVNHHGEDRIKKEVNKVLGQDPIVALKMAEIECKCPFDDCRNARRQDMGIVGQTKGGKNVFIGIEAKVNETFGPAISRLVLTQSIVRYLCNERGMSTSEYCRLATPGGIEWLKALKEIDARLDKLFAEKTW